MKLVSFLQTISKQIKSIYHKTSTSGILLIFLVLFLILIFAFKIDKKYNLEGYQQNDKFLFKRDTAVYDDFYSSIYDFLVYNDVKDEYEIGIIINRTNPTTKSVILDVGCGTGHHVGLLAKQKFNVIGIDISPSMIQKAKENYPSCQFVVGNVLNSGQFPFSKFTHVLCLYFTVYYFDNKETFFRNVFDWLMPGGFFILHLVDREKFDPILPAGNPLYIVSPQKYAKERITKSKVAFDKFKYESNFIQDISDPTQSTFEEKFVFNDGTSRHHEHRFYMEPHQDILVLAKQVGFLVQGEINMIKCAYENQYLYILTKQAN